MAKRSQPAWEPPKNTSEVKLELFNSLTRKKEVFVPQEGKRVTWYNCGPTVYDASHMGHARTYLSFDILRRVMSNYFGYDIFYVMNITDLDDKIIKRARQNYLYEGYLKDNHPLDKILADCNLVITHFAEVVQKTEDPDKRNMQQKLFDKLKAALANIEAAWKANDEGKEVLLCHGKDQGIPWLLSMYFLHTVLTGLENML